MTPQPTPSLPYGEVGDFEHINRIEAMRNRLAAGETSFALDELKLTLAWADHLNYFLSGEKRETATLLAALTASEAERERLKSRVQELEGRPTEDAYMRACRALHWHTAQLRANGIEPTKIAEGAPHYPPDDAFTVGEYQKDVADELARIAQSVGGSESVTGLLILGLLDTYETQAGGPRCATPKATP